MQRDINKILYTMENSNGLRRLTILKLFFILRHNLKLSSVRNPMFESNQFSKVFTFIGSAFILIYFVGIGTAIGAAAGGAHPEVIFGLLGLLLPMDFGMRFGAQQTPSLMIKPYMIMPLRKQDIIDCFLVSILTIPYNLIWLALVIPYCFIIWCGGATLTTVTLVFLMAMGAFYVNSMWYLFCRSLIQKHLAWALLPAATELPLFILLFINNGKAFEHAMDFLATHGFTWYAAVIGIVLFGVLFVANRHLQMMFVDIEVAKKEKETKVNVSAMSGFNRFGIMGEYLKIEIKSALRNKSIKTAYLTGLAVIIMLSCMIAYTDVYSGNFAINTWCVYCFIFFGAVNLIKIMGPEGNYIDMLMVHKENIYDLLKAKYYFFCSVLIIPLVLLIPPMVTGKMSPLMIVSYLFTASGLCYFILFQLAVYNRQTISLNTKMTSKGKFENTLQFVIEMVVFFLPVILVMILSTIFGDAIAYIILLVIGLTLTASHHIWLRNIYDRLMKRRYLLIEGLKETRQ